MLYEARIVKDDELPSDVDRVLVERPDACPLVLVKESTTPAVVKWYEEEVRGRRSRPKTA